MKTQRAADLITGVVLTILGGIALYGAIKIQNLNDEGLQSYTFPLLIAILLLVTGIPLTIQAWRSKERQVVDWPERDGLKRMAVMLGSLSVAVALIPVVGFPISSVLVVAFQVWYLGRDRWYLPVASGVLTGLTIYFVFIKLLSLSLPTGLFD